MLVPEVLACAGIARRCWYLRCWQVLVLLGGVGI